MKNAPQTDPAEPLKGSLMLADPTLRDPNFVHTVLLLTEHSEEAGAVGYIINRPLGKTVSDLLGEADLDELAHAQVYIGGPVATDHLTFASIGWDEEEGRPLVSTHLSLAGARHALDEGFELRAFVGYAGWDEGQLESELEEKSWITEPATREIFDIDPNESMWNEVLRNISPYHRLLAEMPSKPELN